MLTRYSRKAQPTQYSNSICLHSAKTRYCSTFNNSWYAWLHYVGYVVLLPLHMTGVTMIDDTLKEIRFVFNVGLLHSPYVGIYQKKNNYKYPIFKHTYTHSWERERIREMKKYICKSTKSCKRRRCNLCEYVL